MIKYCRVCKKQFSIPPSKERGYKNRQANKNFFCSRDCYKIYWKENIGQKGNKHWNWSGGNIKRKCDFCGKEFEKERNGKDRTYRFCSRKCFVKWLKGRYVGKKNPNWKGSPVNESRSYTDYLKWGQKIKRRDKQTCQKCGSKENLNAHHIKSYAKYPKLKLELSNGITLCKKCHIKIHSRS